MLAPPRSRGVHLEKASYPGYLEWDFGRPEPGLYEMKVTRPEIRRMRFVERLSIREIARRTGHDRKRPSGRSAPMPRPYARARAGSKLDPFKDEIERCCVPTRGCRACGCLSAVRGRFLGCAACVGGPAFSSTRAAKAASQITPLGMAHGGGVAG